MKRIILAVLVIGLGSSLACSKKPGYVANGLFVKPSFLVSTCGAYYKQLKSLINFSSTIKYLETYLLNPDDTGIVGPFIEKTMSNKGYTLVSSKQNGETYNYGYKKGNSMIIIGFAPLSGVVLLTLTGNN